MSNMSDEWRCAILITYHSKTMIYLIRHGQAGSRDNYDVLSDLGRTQAELLGKHLACRLPEVTAVYSGTMRRQLHTAEIVCGVMSASGVRIPVTIPDEKWNEISLAAMYRAMAPRMRAVDPGFDRDLGGPGRRGAQAFRPRRRALHPADVLARGCGRGRCAARP